MTLGFIFHFLRRDFRIMRPKVFVEVGRSGFVDIDDTEPSAPTDLLGLDREVISRSQSAGTRCKIAWRLSFKAQGPIRIGPPRAPRPGPPYR